MKVNIPDNDKAISCGLLHGPIFDQKIFYIDGDSNLNEKSASRLCLSYQHPLYAKGTTEAQCFLEINHILNIQIFER
jgi:hypothetical protein